MTAERMDICPPCGGCRQRLSEFGGPDTPVPRPAGRPARDDHGRRAAPARVRPRAPVSWREAARVLMTSARGLRPRVGVVLGSGLSVAEAVREPTVVDYDDLPASRVDGRRSRRARGRGRIGGVPVAVLQGRAHVYEGGDLDAIRTPMRALRRAGAEILVLTNAAGSLRAEVGPGRAHGDHRSHQPEQHERAHRPERRRDRPALPEPARRVRPRAARGAARGRGSSASSLPRASTSLSPGPTFETPAEIRAFGRSAPTPWGCRPSTRRGRAPRRAASGGGVRDHQLAEGMAESRSATSRRCATRPGGRRPRATPGALQVESLSG